MRGQESLRRDVRLIKVFQICTLVDEIIIGSLIHVLENFKGIFNENDKNTRLTIQMSLFLN